jgi:mRNA-degrading endonuclease RelE of RelBE toxin-antitoxin system
VFAQVVISDRFQTALRRLSPEEQALVKQTCYDFVENPSSPGFSLHRLDRAQDRNWWSLRVNDDLRIVLSHHDRYYILCYVGHHDDAYRWAEKRKFERSEGGALRVVLLEEEVRKVIKKQEVDAPLSRYSADYLKRLGVPAEWCEALRHACEDDLIELIDEFPAEVWERIERLFRGDIVPELVKVEVQDPMLHPDTRRRFWTPQSLDELKRALELPWEKWLVYLHPQQRYAVERRYNGPARVTGAAGTGKTVVAVHRTREMFLRYSAEPILLTTFSRSLAERLRHQLRLLMGDVPRQVWVQHLHQFAVGYWRRQTGHSVNIVDDQQQEQYLEQLYRQTSVPVSFGFLRLEWQSVIEPWAIRTLQDYLQTERYGRKVALPRERRAQIWHVFEQMWRWLDEQNGFTWSMLCYAVAESVRANPPFRCVIVDEAQDFGPAELTLVRALCAPNEDDLFLCGDAGQRIYRVMTPWSRLGIITQGRSTRLYVNYRTTAQIQQQAERLLPEHIDSEEDEERSYLRPLALLRGEAPVIRPFYNRNAEAEGLAEWIWQRLREDYQPGDMAVFARAHSLLEEFVPVLEKRGLPCYHLSEIAMPSSERLAVGTTHRAKGLEFKVVAVVGVDDFWFPCHAELQRLEDPQEREAFINQERQLLYVACTRARERLWLSYTGTPSRFLPNAGAWTQPRPLSH